MSNPLLDFSGLPRFAEIKDEHITPAIDLLLKENRAVVEKVRGDDHPPTWQNFVQPMVDAGERLSRAWGAGIAFKCGDEQSSIARNLQC